MNPLSLPPADCRYGAPMGHPETLPNDPTLPLRLRMVRMPFVDGCYSRDGTYWGMPANVYHAQSIDPVNTHGEPAVLFCRAGNREEAKSKILSRVPGALFFR